MKVEVAAIQFEPTLFRKEDNILALLALVEEAAQNNAKLITTPEMATTGYCWYSREEVAPFVESVPGNTTERFRQIASRYNCYIVLGMPEVDLATDLYYNSGVLIGPEGVIGVHRKTHPYISEPKWATSGNMGHQVFDTPIGKIGILICMDIHYVETARLLAIQEADVICHISNWLAERTPAPYWITRAFENDVYLMESNRWGLERGVQFSGGSCIINPDGSIQTSIDSGDGITYGVIETGREKSWNRQPKLYKEMTLDTYLWEPETFFNLYNHQVLPKGNVSKVSVVNYMPEKSSKVNLERIKKIIHTEIDKGANLIVFPEKALGSQELGINEDVWLELESLTIHHNCYLVIGFLETDGIDTFNSAALLGPTGFMKTYRQIHVEDQSNNKPGDHWCIADTELGRIGILIGEDLKYPESARVLALKGCDLICVVADWSGPLVMQHPGTNIAQNYPIPTNADPYHWHLARTRAGENNVYLAFANGKHSGIFGPETFVFPREERMALADDTAALSIDTTRMETNLGNPVRQKAMLQMRQPLQYHSLVLEKKQQSVKGFIH